MLHWKEGAPDLLVDLPEGGRVDSTRQNAQIQDSMKLSGRRWLLAAMGLLLLDIVHPLTWGSERTPMFFAPIGLGLALLAWLGYRLLPLMAVNLVLVQILFRSQDTTIWQGIVEALLTTIEVGAGWWCYQRAGGTRRLDDPRSTTLFLLLVPGLFGGLFACLQAFFQIGVASWEEFAQLSLEVWIGHVLAIVALSPRRYSLWLLPGWFTSDWLASILRSHDSWFIHALAGPPAICSKRSAWQSERAFSASCSQFSMQANRERRGTGGACCFWSLFGRAFAWVYAAEHLSRDWPRCWHCWSWRCCRRFRTWRRRYAATCWPSAVPPC